MDSKDRLILSRSDKAPKKLRLVSQRPEIVRESGSFFGILVPMSARRLTGLDPGTRYRLFIEKNHRLVVEKIA